MIWREELGMFCIDRSRAASCVHQSEWCKENCYCAKFEVTFPNMLAAEEKYEAEWQALTGPELSKQLRRKRKQTNRLRLCAFGEPFADKFDVARICDWLRHCPDTTFWIPTRAWRSSHLERLIRQHVMSRQNARVLASVDPSTLDEFLDKGLESYWREVAAAGVVPWDTHYQCPKTWQHKHGHCAVCQGGCFARTGDIQLKQHR